MQTNNDACDVELVQSREDQEREAREMAIRLEAEAADQAVIDEELRARLEWLAEFQEGAVA